ncbi:MAG: Dihydrolipoamide acetyltransferase component of pyruvate dehydrogenase complex [Verrucomicrobiales bacterium]|nr:Dihydrolipoamide acetyltransferase component of pyruvate dehydrogenase complex [Verrucomicrobiales bacterium]
MDVKLPNLGEGADSGTVVNIYVKEGDQVSKGQSIIELETGKAVAPVPSSATGKVTKVMVAVGDKISVGAPLISVADGAGAPAPAAAKPAAPAKPGSVRASVAAAPAPVAEEEELEVEADDADAGGPPPAASPTIRHMARELGIDLRKIRGSENGGRIVMSDLRAYVQRLTRLAAQPRIAAAAAAPAAPAKKIESIDFSKWGPVVKKPMTQLRKVISQRMAESWNAVPRVTQFDEADLTIVTDLRKKYADAYDKKGAKLTLTSFAIKVVADALKKHPMFNTSIDEAAGDIIFKEYIHVGVAVDTDQGLIVPVIRDADTKDMVRLSKELNDLATKTRERKIGIEELQGGSFTISNQGGIGGGHFTPIVNKPEVAILGIGRGSLKAVVREGKIEPRLMLPLTLAYDHRVIDGGTAVRFMLEIVQGFEKFNEAAVKIS